MSRKTSTVAALVTLASLVALTALVGHIRASSASAQGEASQTITKYIYESFDSWQKTNDIKIQPEAEERIKEGFLKEQSYLEYVFNRHHMESDAQRQLLEALVAEYLYDLRDWKPADKRAAATTSSDRPRLRAASLMEPAQLVPDTIVITVELVTSFPVSEFLKQLRPVLDGPQTPGQLEVVSTPEKESITIDGQEKGNTCKTFVVSPGKHTVAVHGKTDCTGDVVVGEGKTERFCCPKGTGCPKWKDGKKCTAP